METIKVNGMHCEHCKAAVEKAIQGLPGIRSAQVNLDTKELTYEVDDNLPVPMELVKETVRELGYDPL